MYPPTVWIIDDDESILQVVSIILEQESINSTRINDPQSVLPKLSTGPLPNLILLDVLMSGTDGRDIARAIKSDARYKSIPIIIMTADIHAQEKATQALANDFISKPFDIDELINKVKQYLALTVQSS